MGLLVQRVLHRCRPGFAPCVQLVIHQSARAGQAPSGSKSMPHRNAVHATTSILRAGRCVCDTDPLVSLWLWLASAREELQNYMINMLNDTRRCQGTCVQSHMCYEASSSDRQSLPGSGPLRSEALLLPHSISAMPKGLLCQYDLITQPWASCTPRAGACPTL